MPRSPLMANCKCVSSDGRAGPEPLFSAARASAIGTELWMVQRPHPHGPAPYVTRLGQVLDPLVVWRGMMSRSISLSVGLMAAQIANWTCVLG